MNTQNFLLPILVLGLIATGIYFYTRPAQNEEQANNIKTTVQQGEFMVNVTATGELKAKRSVKIRAPQGLQAAGIWQTNIADLIAEGTLVKAGDYVGALDRTELSSKMTDAQGELDRVTTQLEQAKIDTAIELRGIRDELVNLNFTKKEKILQVEQAKFEPQSVIQQTQLDLERTERDYLQLVQKYKLKQQQSEAKIEEINSLFKQNQSKMDRFMALSNEFKVKAPEDGMVIYARSWNGKKEPGARITPWDNVVAELPDLSDMISKSYVNEVDISKVREGQEVSIKVDAFPDKAYSGKVTKVANIGEQLKGYDAKVFEVIIQVMETDSILRPAMTTSNEILTNRFEDVVFIPLEALQNDSLSFVYKDQDGRIVKQEIAIGATNNDEVIVQHGLKKNDEIYFIPPDNAADLPIQRLDPNLKNLTLKTK